MVENDTLGFMLAKEFHTIIPYIKNPEPTSRTSRLLFGDTVHLEHPIIRPSVFLKSLYKEVQELGGAILGEHTNKGHLDKYGNVRHEIADCVYKLMVTSIGLGSESFDSIHWESKLLESGTRDTSAVYRVIELGKYVLRLSFLAWVGDVPQVEKIIDGALGRLGRIRSTFEITADDIRDEMSELERRSKDPSRVQKMETITADEAGWGLSTFRPYQPCFLCKNIRCNKVPIHQSAKEVFVGYQFKSKHYKTSNLKIMIREVFVEEERNVYFPDEHESEGHITCDICEHILSCCLGVFEITDANANVMLELGLAYGTGKHCLLLRKSGATSPELPDDLSGMQRIEYDSEVDIREQLKKVVEEIKLPTWKGYTPPRRLKLEIKMTDDPGSLGKVATELGKMGINISTVTTWQSVPGKNAKGFFNVEVPMIIDFKDLQKRLHKNLESTVFSIKTI